MPGQPGPRVGVVMLAFGAEDLLEEAVGAVLDSTAQVELVVVDNGCTNPAVDRLRADPRLRWADPGSNTGYAGGCNLGVSLTTAPTVAMVNSDAVVRPDALALLAAALDDPDVGVATGLVALREDPSRVNAAGNPVHWTLLSWAGGYGDEVDAHAAPADPLSASGALMALRRETWQELGGLNDMLFAYGEDLELSLRVWLSGRRVRYVPTAVAEHEYEFSRNPRKMYLLERNRLINLLTLLERPTLWSLSPGLVLFEAGVTWAAWRGGWLDQKVQGWRWLWANRAEVGRRRREVFRARRRPDSVLVDRMADRILPGEDTGVRVPSALNTVFALQGRVARRCADRQARRRP